MKLIIDIPDEDYQRLNSREKIITLSCNIVDVVKNGTPLPKCHGRLIDESKITEVYSQEEVYEELMARQDERMIKRVKIKIIGTDAPTIIEADKAESEDKG